MKKFRIVCEDCNKVCEAVYLNGVVKCTGCGKTLNEEEYMSYVKGDVIVVRENPIIIMDKKAQIACVNCFENLPILDILEMLGREATEDTVLAAATLKQIMNYIVLNIKRATINEKPLKINMEIREE